MKSNKLDRTITILNWAVVATMIINLAIVFFYAPPERLMGNVQRIFYFHVGAAWVGAIAFFVALIAGVLYLRQPNRKYDTIALASVEIGLIFLSMATVAGSIWGKPAWNTWWLWSPRLTMITVAWLTYAAYFMLRGAIEDEEQRGRFAAVYVIIAFLTIVLTFLSVRLMRDIHPVVLGGVAESAQGAEQGLQEFDDGLATKMIISLNISVINFSVLYAAWLFNRIRLQHLHESVTALKMRFSNR